MSAASKKRSPEALAKMVAALRSTPPEKRHTAPLGNKYALGHRLSEDVKQRLAAMATGKRQSAETVRLRCATIKKRKLLGVIRPGNYGPTTPENAARLRTLGHANKGRVYTAEVLVAARAKRRANKVLKRFFVAAREQWLCDSSEPLCYSAAWRDASRNEFFKKCGDRA